ncbi:MAG: hypothetical protein JWO31_3193 [Phycisphaerales bacterium]|nr:hypothetical protein [Phycisphaerales bacterium]
MTSSTSTPNLTKPLATDATAGDAYWLLNQRMRLLATADQTAGAYALVETTIPPGDGPPPHVHVGEDELFYVLDGELALVLGDRRLRAAAGDAVFLPRGVPHTFANPGTRPAKFLVLSTPGGFDRFVAAVGTRTDPATSFDPPAVTPAAVEAMIAGAARAGIEMRFDHRADVDADLPGRTEQVWLLGQLARLKLTAADTNGQFSVMEVVTPPGSGVPPHRHVVEDELFYVLAGTYAVEVDGRREVVGPGAFLRVPRGAWHAFTNVGDTPARMLDVHTPGGFEAFARELGTPCADPDAGPPTAPPDMDRVVGTILKHGMELPARAG